MLYLDSSALVKRYVLEADSDQLGRILDADVEWSSANHTLTEVWMTLGRRLGDEVRSAALTQLSLDWRRTTVVSLDDVLCRRAGVIGMDLRLRALDALHLAAAERAGGPELTFLTFDTRLAAGARTMGFSVVGA
jgi:predicted nucleic acid-binding protein